MNNLFISEYIFVFLLTFVKSDCPKPPSGFRYCPSEWAIFQEYCYQVQTNKYWNEAQSSCKTLSANLVSITTDEENDFITDFAKSGADKLLINSQVWTGAYRDDAQAEWKNIDGRPFRANWAPSYPNNDKKANCVVTLADPSDPGGYYNQMANIACSTVMRAFVCKKPANTID